MKKIKDVIDKVRKEAEVNGVRVVMNGKMQIEEIILNPSLDQEQQSRAVKDCVNTALAQIQQEIATEIRSAQFGI